MKPKKSTTFTLQNTMVMSFFKKHKKFLIITFSVLASVVLLMLLAQLIIGDILENRIENSLSTTPIAIGDKGKYKIDVGNVKVNLFTMTLIFKDISIMPDAALIHRVKLQKTTQKYAVRLNVPTLRIKNIGVIGFVMDKQMDINDFILKNAKMDLLFSGKKNVPSPKKADGTARLFNIDSIVLPGLNGVDVGRFSFRSFCFNIIDIDHGDTVFFAKSLELILENIALIKNEIGSSSFRLVLKDADFHMSDERFLLPGGRYALSFDEMDFNMGKALLVFKGLKIKPRHSRKRMVEMNKHQYEIFDCEMEKAAIHSFYPMRMIRSSKIILSNVIIDEMKLSMFKDKRRPFDTDKRPKLPQQLLKSLDRELYINSLIINKSELVYSERHKMMEEPMVVILGNLNATVSNVTSMFDSIVRGTMLSVKLRADLQKKIPMGVNLYFPMKSVADTFWFHGWLGKGDIKLFNPVVFPAIGIKFKSGHLDGMEFNARANPRYATGEMTMSYHDLKGIVVRNDMKETNKFLSWAANQVIIGNNPSKNKKVRTVPMFFNRVMYKGLGNFVWKTIQSGITATIVPGMDNKVQKGIDATLGTDKKAGRKTNPKKRRKK